MPRHSLRFTLAFYRINFFLSFSSPLSPFIKNTKPIASNREAEKAYFSLLFMLIFISRLVHQNF